MGIGPYAQLSVAVQAPALDEPVDGHRASMITAQFQLVYGGRGLLDGAAREMALHGGARRVFHEPPLAAWPRCLVRHGPRSQLAGAGFPPAAYPVERVGCGYPEHRAGGVVADCDLHGRPVADDRCDGGRRVGRLRARISELPRGFTAPALDGRLDHSAGVLDADRHPGVPVPGRAQVRIGAVVAGGG